MQKWEYMWLMISGKDGDYKALADGKEVAKFAHWEGMVPILNRYGSEGWEVVNKDGANLILKRPLQQS